MSDLGEWVRWGFSALVIPALAVQFYFARSHDRLKQKVEGTDGTNGLASELRLLKQRFDEHERQYPKDLELTRHDRRDNLGSQMMILEGRMREAELWIAHQKGRAER